MERRFQAMADRVARSVTSAGEQRDEAMEKVDQAVDAIIAALTSLDENLPMVKTDTVPEKAAVDVATTLLNEAVKPYMADVVKALDAFDH